MPYKKRVLIFVSTMAVLAAALSIFYILQVRSNLQGADKGNFIPVELREKFRNNVNSVFKDE